VAKIERSTTIIRTGKVRTETAYIVTSLSPQKASPETLMELVRDHWSIENRSHWVRDVTFDEDRSQVRTRSGPRMMAILRNLAIGIIRILGFEHIPDGIRHFIRRRNVLDALGL
jgi:predicted transposase YbfD/YdcC